MMWFLGHYAGPVDDPDASPIAADDLAGMPPAVVSTAGYDPLCDEGEDYAAALAAAGVATTHLRHTGLVHGYALMEAVPPARDATAADLAALADILARRTDSPQLEPNNPQGARR
jgi:acetyl esterase